MGMNHWKREGLGWKKTFPLISTVLSAVAEFLVRSYIDDTECKSDVRTYTAVSVFELHRYSE